MSVEIKGLPPTQKEEKVKETSTPVIVTFLLKKVASISSVTAALFCACHTKSEEKSMKWTTSEDDRQSSFDCGGKRAASHACTRTMTD